MSKLSFLKPIAQAREIYELFSGKVFRVPDYQRNFAWVKEPNWEDFWNDIKEGLSTNTEHYWGTITLQATDETKYCEGHDTWFRVYEIVDGQQRITSIYLFLLALSNIGNKPAIKDNYIKSDSVYRLELGGLNNQFLKDLVDGKNPQPDIKTNRLLKGVLEYFEGHINAYGNLDDLSKYLQRVTFSLEFVVQNKTLAVKTFETLNDRGKALTLLDKTKSHLMFFSYRYLKDSNISEIINRTFGNIFTNYDFIKEIGEEEEIYYIKSRRFIEDEILRFFYHYFASYAISKFSLRHAYNYDISAENVFDRFLKPTCNLLKDDKLLLTQFITEFLEYFDKFINAFKNVIFKTQSDCQFKKLFSFLGLNARVYPLIISLETEGFLNKTMITLIESLDLRVYKIRGTEPRAGLYRYVISQIKRNPNVDQISNNIRWFIDSFMPDTELQAYLARWIYRNPAIKYMLWEYEKNLNPSFNDCNYNFYKDLQVEHIFPVTSTLSFPAYGFNDEREYFDNINRIGNLTLLETDINVRVSNKVPVDKANDYVASNATQTKQLGYYINNHGFKKGDQNTRSQKIINFCLNRWAY